MDKVLVYFCCLCLDNTDPYWLIYLGRMIMWAFHFKYCQLPYTTNILNVFRTARLLWKKKWPHTIMGDCSNKGTKLSTFVLEELDNNRNTFVLITNPLRIIAVNSILKKRENENCFPFKTFKKPYFTKLLAKINFSKTLSSIVELVVSYVIHTSKLLKSNN